jgi:ATP-dependent DNA helicase RecG
MPLPARLPLSAKVGVLRGLGPARTEALEEAGLGTLRELLWSLPYRYVDRGSVIPLQDLEGRFLTWSEERGSVTVLATVKELRQSTSRIQRMAITEALLDDGTGRLRVVWFNQPYLARTLRPGDRILAFGALAQGRNGLELRAPQFELMGRGSEVEDDFTQRFLPLYRKVGALTSRVREKVAQQALALASEPEDILPAELSSGLPSLFKALQLLHQPPPDSDPGLLEQRATPAHGRLAAEELFAFALGVSLRRAGRMQRPGNAVPTSPELRERLKGFLPFRLTGAQRRAFKEIVDDLVSGHVMHRMLQGDVGSGKTMVAFLAMAMVAETGGQAALLAPTEVLARQHAATFAHLLGEGAPRLQLLLGGMKAADKREALARISGPEANYIVGTHAIFQEAVAFRDLRFVVVDEQHRFGVLQREALKAKGGDPHWLVMSATPIPRSLALAFFGDLDQSVLDELPPGRQPITTRLFDPEEGERAWAILEKELQAGRQAYVVSPAIDPADETKVNLRDLQAMQSLLRSRLPEVPMDMVHGRLKPAEFAQRMGRFISGEARLLLATTVIEVGVDVANATVMVVDHAERFGLSQLHQLRGRVGRGSVRSHFLMLSRSETERLQTLLETQDGFKIAQRDLELRGPGEFFGTRQSGLPQFQVADLLRDKNLLLRCREAAERALSRGLSVGQLAWLKAEQARLRLAEVS